MRITKDQISAANQKKLIAHQESYKYAADQLHQAGKDSEAIIQKIQDFQVAIPSWALGAGGTRFGRFSYGGEPGNLEQKIDDVGIIHALTRSGGGISLHIPWDIPKDPAAIKELADSHNIIFDAVNSNTFQDQPGQELSYKYGSLSHVNKEVRAMAIEHNKEVIKLGDSLGSKSLTVWLADGSCFPGQNNLRKAFDRTQESLQSIYSELPGDWKMFIEYKPYEPAFYSTVIQDWGASYSLAQGCGDQAYCLVDLGHHLPNSNIEQIVAMLMSKGKLGGFHFNDSKYGDDDLTVGCIKPYQLFLIFNELVYGMENNDSNNPDLAWMIDASHNIKDPLEDLIQSLEAINIAHTQALIVDQKALAEAQNANDVVRCQEIIQHAFRTDVRPLVREAKMRAGAALYPLETYRALQVRENLILERGREVAATGL